MSLLPTLAFLGLLVLMAEASGAFCDCRSQPRHPVCGYDFNTYVSPCSARCAGMRIRHVGICQNPYQPFYGVAHGYRCNCGHVAYSPVCADNGGTYSNDCLARCSGRRVVYAGKCRTAAVYSGVGQYGYNTRFYRTAACDHQCVGRNDRYPVCCSDANTYLNACQARCAGAHIFYYGRCDRQIYYNSNYGQCGNCYGQSRNLVCGYNARTYYNQCFCDCSYTGSTNNQGYNRIGVNYSGACSGLAYNAIYY